MSSLDLPTIPPEIIGEILSFVSSVSIFHNCLLLSTTVRTYLIEENPECARGIKFSVDLRTWKTRGGIFLESTLPYVSYLHFEAHHSEARDVAFAAISHLPCLRVLELDSVREDITTEVLSSLSGPLETFSISSHRCSIEDSLFLDSPAVFTSLRSLSLHGCTELTPAIFAGLPRLEKLYIMGGTGIAFDVDAMRPIFQTLKKLVLYAAQIRCTDSSATPFRFGLFENLEVLECRDVWFLRGVLGQLSPKVRKLSVKNCDGFYVISDLEFAVGVVALERIEEVIFEEYYEEDMGDICCDPEDF